MDRPFHYLESSSEPEGTALGVGVSLTLHVAVLIVLFMNLAKPAEEKEEPLRFVELVPQIAAAAPRANAQPFVEAPGPEIAESPRPEAALSDANRRASAPEATGDQATRSPGDGSGGLHVPGLPPASAGASAAPAVPPVSRPAEAGHRGNGDSSSETAEGLQYRVDAREQAEEMSRADAAIDWRSAIRDMGRTPAAGGAARLGGEAGFAESGPLSFETQWYDWGPYAAHMIAKIRLHWYENMPEVIRLGLKGVVVIRFTIQRNGQITDITLLESSGVPPFDFAAQKAIELASPLNPLPRDFPEGTEKVTAAFYYNMNPPKAGR